MRRLLPAVLREPRFRLLFSDRALSMLGTFVALSFAVLSIGGGRRAVAAR